MLENWLNSVIAERAVILTRVAPVPEPKIDLKQAKEDIYTAAAALIAWEHHSGTDLETDSFLEAVLAASRPEPAPEEKKDPAPDA